MQAKNIFFIGPGSVGKSTAAEALARRLGRRFVDVDQQFCDRIALIPHYVRDNGYVAYCEANSALVDELVKEYPMDTVFATPSGFLAHEESPHLIEKHLEVIARGTSILLLPAGTAEAGVDLIVARQLARFPELNANREREIYLSRFRRYCDKGDVRIVSTDSAESIVDEIMGRLRAPN